ncbi:MAG: nitrate reductase / nitrite oxidoreductase, beta subunit, partial [Pseudomonadota bacterium]|nr:nitrate reductase / nitrite oxidoreductase, beta subunit [Pseudomonadota bacterium]
HGSDTKFNLFNSKRIDAIDVSSKTRDMNSKIMRETNHD